MCMALHPNDINECLLQTERKYKNFKHKTERTEARNQIKENSWNKLKRITFAQRLWQYQLSWFGYNLQRAFGEHAHIQNIIPNAKTNKNRKKYRSKCQNVCETIKLKCNYLQRFESNALCATKSFNFYLLCVFTFSSL